MLDAEKISNIVENHPVTIRPIQPGDKCLELSFIDALSPQSKHYRFFGGVGKISDALLEDLCNVDGKQTMAFIATIEDTERRKSVEVGVSRFGPGETENSREIALTIADDWQSSELGLNLLKRLADYAKNHGIDSLYAVELSDNAYMRNVSRKFGITEHLDPDDVHQVIYRKSV